jgi:hypothetical protein
MSDIIAKPVVKNKFWIVEDHGEKIATIQAIDDGSVVLVKEQQRTKYPSIKILTKEHNIVLDKYTKEKSTPTHDVHGFPTSNKPWNSLWDVQHQFPIYTKTSKSKSYFCAGFYIIKFNHGWSKAYCPKYITLNRYEYQGPFRTKDEMNSALKAENGK